MVSRGGLAAFPRQRSTEVRRNRPRRRPWIGADAVRRYGCRAAGLVVEAPRRGDTPLPHGAVRLVGVDEAVPAHRLAPRTCSPADTAHHAGMDPVTVEQIRRFVVARLAPADATDAALDAALAEVVAARRSAAGGSMGTGTTNRRPGVARAARSPARSAAAPRPRHHRSTQVSLRCADVCRPGTARW